MAAHSVTNPGPEDRPFDQRRHEEMRLKPLGMFGIPKFFVDGFAPSRFCEGCGKVKYWCICAKSEQSESSSAGSQPTE